MTTAPAAVSAAELDAETGHRAALLDATMSSRSTVLAGAILLAAGVYQWLPIKAACLAHCQSPLGFLAAHWRDGAAGGLRMGLRHGAFCMYDESGRLMRTLQFEGDKLVHDVNVDNLLATA